MTDGIHDPLQLVVRTAEEIARNGHAPTYTSVEAEPEGPKRTDSGNAWRLRQRHGRDLLYCKAWKYWLVWDGTRFAPDGTQEVVRRAQETARSIYAEAAGIESTSEQTELAKWAHTSQSEQRIRAMITLASAQSGIAVEPPIFDQDPWLFNCANGTIDLRTGELRAHCRDDRLTKRSPTTYDAAAVCPIWTSFLHRIMDGSEEKIDFLQRAFGYSLTGNTGEEVCFIAYGRGRNGKSKCLGAVEHVMGDYARHASPKTFLARNQERVENDVAALAGARFVPTMEVEDGARLAESLVKQMTGGDKITARFLFAEYFEFHPQFKIWLATNHKPVIKGTDIAIWQRLRLIPFTVTIPPEEQDKRLAEKLEAEASGILRWMIEGCLKWQSVGLSPPPEIVEATAQYRDEMDLLGPFFEDRCVILPDLQVTAGSIYQEYVHWCESSGVRRPLSQRDFGTALKERGFEPDRVTGGLRIWLGIGLRQPEE